MDDIDRTSGGSPNSDKIQSILDASLSETDFFCRKSRSLLGQLGLPQGEDLMLLAGHKSRVKYGYVIASDTLSHLLDLAGQREKQSLRRLVESPFFLVKEKIDREKIISPVFRTRVVLSATFLEKEITPSAPWEARG